MSTPCVQDHVCTPHGSAGLVRQGASWCGWQKHWGTAGTILPLPLSLCLCLSLLLSLLSLSSHSSLLVSVFLSLSLFFSVSVYLPVSVFRSLSLSLSFAFCLSISVSLSLSRPITYVLSILPSFLHPTPNEDRRRELKLIVLCSFAFCLLFFFPLFFKAIDELINKGLPLMLVTIGQQHLLNKFSFVKAYFFIKVAATINCVPERRMKTVCHGLTNEKSRGNLSSLKGNLFFLACFSSYCLSPAVPHSTLITHVNILVCSFPVLSASTQ